MAVHKHQGDRDYGLLSLNGRLGLGRDWIAAGQFAGSSTGGGPGYAYHASTNWRNQSRLSGFVELEEIGDRFRPNETGLEDEAYRRARGAITFRNEYSEGSKLNALVVRGRVFRQTEAGGRVFRQTEAGGRVFRQHGSGRAAARAVRAGRGIARRRPFRLLFARPQRTTERSRTAVEDAICRGRPRIRVDIRFRRALQPGRQPPGRFQLAHQPRRRRQPVQPPDDRPEGQRFYWSARRETLLLRTTTNYQFTRKVGLRLFHERVIERTSDTTEDNFNTVFDYEFTPESHFFLVFVRDRDRSRAVFSKIAYLFGRV